MSVMVATDPDADLLAAAAAGDEQAFAALVDRHGAALLRAARMHVPSDAVAQEVLQDTWIGVLRGAQRFEGRSTVRTWLFTIVANRAKTQGARERRTVPFAALGARDAGDAADGDRFLPAEHARWPHHWAAPPRRWEEQPEERLGAEETLEMVRGAVELLSPLQRLVITMRDLEGFESSEVCKLLGISETNQRVLLHRARAHVRSALAPRLARDAA